MLHCSRFSTWITLCLIHFSFNTHVLYVGGSKEGVKYKLCDMPAIVRGTLKAFGHFCNSAFLIAQFFTSELCITWDT